MGMNIFIEVVDKVFNKTTYADKPEDRTYPELDEAASKARAQAVDKLKKAIKKPDNVVGVVKALSENWDALGPEYQDRLTYTTCDINGREKRYPFISNSGIPLFLGRERIQAYPNLDLKLELDSLARNLERLAKLHKTYLTAYENELDAIFDYGVKAEKKKAENEGAGDRKPYTLNEFAHLLTGFLSPEPKALSPIRFAKFMRYHLSVIDTIKPETWAFYTDGMADHHKKAIVQELKHKNWILRLQQNKYPEDEILAYMAAIYLNDFGLVSGLERFQKVGKKCKLIAEVKDELIERFAEREKRELRPALVKEEVEFDEDDDEFVGMRMCFRVQEDFTHCVDHAHRAKHPHLLRALYANAAYTDEYYSEKCLSEQPINFNDPMEEDDNADYPRLLSPLEYAVNNESSSYMFTLLSMRGVRTAFPVREYERDRTLSMLSKVFKKNDRRAMAAIVSAQPAVVFVCLDREVPLIMALKHSSYSVQLLLDAGALEDRYPDPNPSFIGTLFERDRQNAGYVHQEFFDALEDKGSIERLKIVYQAFSAEQKAEFVKQYQAYQREKFQNEITSITFMSRHQENLVKARRDCFEKCQAAEDKLLTELRKDTAKPSKVDADLGFMPEYFGRLALGSAALISEAERAEQLYWDSANTSLQKVREVFLRMTSINAGDKKAFRQLTLKDPKKKFSSRDVVAVVKFSLAYGYKPPVDIIDEAQKLLLSRELGPQVEALVQAGDKATVRNLLGLLKHMGVERESISKKIIEAACFHLKSEPLFNDWVNLVYEVNRLPGESKTIKLEDLWFLTEAVAALDNDVAVARIKKLAEKYTCISPIPAKPDVSLDFQYRCLMNCLEHNRIEAFRYLIKNCGFTCTIPPNLRGIDREAGYKTSVLEHSLWHESPRFFEALTAYDQRSTHIQLVICTKSDFSKYFAFAHYQFDKIPLFNAAYKSRHMPSTDGIKHKVRKAFGLKDQITQPIQMVHYLFYLSTLTDEQRAKHKEFFGLLKELLNLDDLEGALALETLSVDKYIARYHGAFTRSLSRSSSVSDYNYVQYKRRLTASYAAEQWNKVEHEAEHESRRELRAKAALKRKQHGVDPAASQRRRIDKDAYDELAKSLSDKRAADSSVDKGKDNKRGRTDPDALRQMAKEVDGPVAVEALPDELLLSDDVLREIEEIGASAAVPTAHSPTFFTAPVSTDAATVPGVPAAVPTDTEDDQGAGVWPTSPGAGAGYK